MTKGFCQNRLATRCEQGATLVPIRRSVFGSIPGLHREGRSQQPGLGGGDLLPGRNKAIDQTGVDGGLAGKPRPLQQDWQGRLQPDQPGEPLGSAPARKQAHQGFRQA